MVLDGSMDDFMDGRRLNYYLAYEVWSIEIFISVLLVC